MLIALMFKYIGYIKGKQRTNMSDPYDYLGLRWDFHILKD